MARPLSSPPSHKRGEAIPEAKANKNKTNAQATGEGEHGLRLRDSKAREASLARLARGEGKTAREANVLNLTVRKTPTSFAMEVSISNSKNLIKGVVCLEIKIFLFLFFF